MNQIISADALRFGRDARAVRRQEDQRLLVGDGRYADDKTAEGMVHMVLLRSPVAHAAVTSLDVSAAKEAPGVVAVYTLADLDADGVRPMPWAAEIPRPDGKPFASPPRKMLAGDTVRFVGDPVAVVIAESRAAAQDAAELIEVEYDEKPAATSTEAVIAGGAPAVWPDAPDNISCGARHGDAAATEAAFAKAHHVAKLRIVNQRLVGNAMEPRAVLAVPDGPGGHVTLNMGSQNPSTVKTIISGAIFGFPDTELRVLVEDIGGGFGLKANPYVEDALAVYAARKLGKPVKWRADRGEEFTSVMQGRDHVSEAELAVDPQGRILGMRVKTWANLGAYVSTVGPLVPLMLGPKVITSVYDVPALDLEVIGVLTNTTPTSPYRGAGRPEAVFLMERMIEQAARDLKMDPLEIRQRNYIRRDAMPYTNAMGEVYDVGDFGTLQGRAVELADWKGFDGRKAESKSRGLLRGRGMASYVEWTGAMQFTEAVTVEAYADGRILLWSGTQDMGQGLRTAYAQLVAQKLGVPVERITVVQGDTDRVGGFGSMASRSLFTGGPAAVTGAQALIDKGRELAADALEAAAADITYEEGRFTISGTDRSIDLSELAGRQDGGMFLIDASETVAGSSWPNGHHFVEVEVDPDTGRVALVKITTLDDVGHPVNPLIVFGQLQGGMAQGIGQALLEQAVYDPENGQPLTGSFMDYCMPRADDLPSMDVNLDESVPCTTNPLGAKGCGESGTVGITAAVVAAVLDALAPLGVSDIQMPMTPDRVWQAIRDASA
ncbi:xanthine dehydrogenase family protein molybdopterin-binding subunit [Marinibaculum pumilum]|uniref:Xanthine dehydrogenase family protein molybdopterin-binding subunit n=1 Tax=Marinibaculum pumilum TaxID=1766165 RepID=A0ABV7L3S8_9PROT